MKNTEVVSILLKGKIIFDGGQLGIMPVDIINYLDGLETVESNDHFGKNFYFDIVAYNDELSISENVGEIAGRFFDLQRMNIEGVEYEELLDDIDQYTWELYESTKEDNKSGHFHNMYVIEELFIDKKFRNLKLGTTTIIMLEEMIKAQFNKQIGIFVLQPNLMWIKEDIEPSEEEQQELKLKLIQFWRRLGFQYTDNNKYMYFNTDFDMRKIYKSGNVGPFVYTMEDIDKFHKLSDAKSVFISLKNKKKAGLKINFEYVSKEEMFMMWAYDKISDERIAKLFGTTIPKVTYLREKYGITKKNIENNSEEIADCIRSCIRIYNI